MEHAKLFYSYSHCDEKYREQLEKHLSILSRNGLISEWHDRRIAAGTDWQEQIDLNLEDADIILLLVSSDFLASDYCYETETIRAIQKHEDGESIVIPIILRPCMWQDSKLAKLQALPRDNKAISLWSDKDEAWLHVSMDIRDQIKALQRSVAAQVPAEKLRLSKDSDKVTDLVLRFLIEYRKWYFSPLRIQKWGGRRYGYEALLSISTKEIANSLNTLLQSGRVTSTLSQKGNTIYKAK
jgi:hypothetical protein